MILYLGFLRLLFLETMKIREIQMTVSKSKPKKRKLSRFTEQYPGQPKYSRSITVDELTTYMYCGEYYREYLYNNKVPLYDHRVPVQVLAEHMIKWLMSQYGLNKAWPSEMQIMHRLAFGTKILEAQGSQILWASRINALLLGLLNLRNHLAEKKIRYISHMANYVAESMSVSYSVLIVTDDNTVYMISHMVLDKFVTSPLALFSLLDYGPTYSYKAIVLKEDSVSIEDVPRLSELNIENVKKYINSVLRGIANKVYIPIFRCSNTKCPHYLNCYPGGEDYELDV